MFSASSAVKIQVDLCLWSAKSKEFGEILGQFSPAVAVGPRVRELEQLSQNEQSPRLHT